MRNTVKIIFIILLISQPMLAQPFSLRVMPLGNSITHGVVIADPNENNYVGYRKDLFESLDAIYPNLDFVGSLTHGAGVFDKDHEGHRGWMADEVRDEVEGWLDDNPADIVLLHIGTNDIGTGATPASIANEVESILDNIDQYETDNNTEVVVFVARIVRLIHGMFDGTETIAFNNAVETMVNQRIANGDKLVMVDQESALSYPGGLDFQGIHPIQSSYDDMATVWEQAITNTLATPDITDPGAQTANVGENFEYQIVASGVPTPSIQVDNLPTGMTYDPGTQTVSWVPDAGQAGAASFDATATNAIGADNLNLAINVNTMFVPPTGSDETVNTDENADYTFNPLDFTFMDGDGDLFAGIQVVTLPGVGTLEENGTPMDLGVDDIVEDVGLLVFKPVAGGNGMSYASFTFRVRSDNGGEVSAIVYTMDIDVNPLNSAPTFTAGGNETVDEDAGAQSVAWASAIDDGDPEIVQDLDFIVNNDNNPLFSVQPAIDDGGTLTYTPAPNANGVANVSVTLQDEGSNVAPNENSSATVNFTITVNAVNDAPSFTAGGNEIINENAGPQTVNNWATDIEDGDPEITQDLDFIVNNNNNALFSVQPAIDDGGTLTYTTAANINGVATVTVRLEDDGDDTPPNQNSSGTANFTITVNAVNSEPSFTAGGNQVVNEDAGPQSVSWASDINDGDPELNQGLDFIVNNNNNALFSAQPAIDDAGTLTYTPAPNANGAANVTVRLEDDGDDTPPNDNVSPTVNFTITVNAVNDAPSFTKGPDQNVNEDAGPQTVNNWATDLNDGDPELNQDLNFVIDNNTNPGLFASGPEVDPSGTLTYESALNANGTATITLRIEDDGSNTPPNVNTSAAQTFDIVINPINDPPVVNTSGGNTSYLESSGVPVIIIDGAVTITDPDDTNLASGSVAFTGTYISAEDALQFVPAGTSINGVFDEGTGIMTLTGTHPVGDYEDVLQNIQYLNKAGSNPTGGPREITFSVTDGDGLTGSDTKTVVVVTDNSPPALSGGGISDVEVDEDAPNFTIELFKEFEDDEDPDTDLVFAVENNTNPGLFTSTNIAPATGILTLDFAPDAFGVAQLTVSATDTDGASTNSVFTVTVNGVNDQPTTSGIPDVNVNEDAPNSVINLWDHFDDLEDADADLVFDKVPPSIPGLFSDIIIDNGSGTLTLAYSPNSHGIASITIRVTDTGGLTEVATFSVNVAPINDQPLMDVIPDPAAILEDAGQQEINLSGINAGPNESQTLIVSAETTSTGLLIIDGVEYTSPQTTGILRYTPVANASGSGQIEVCVTDDGPSNPPHNNQLCRTLTVVVDPVNDDPTIDPVDDPSTIFVNAGEQCVPLSGISAGPGENQTISVIASSSNAGLIPNNPGSLNVTYTSPDATGQVCYTPLPDQSGTTTIVITVLDDQGGTTVETFDVVVSPVNQEPTIDPVPDFAIDEDAASASLTLTNISAGPGESQELVFELVSDNTDLFDPMGPSLSINYQQGSAEATLLYTPIENASGEANITVRLTDNGPGDPPNDNQVEITFKITVNAINDAPTLDVIPDQGVFDLGEEPPLVNLTGISEGPNENQTVIITFSSDNPSLVDPAKILVDFDPANDFGSLTYAIEPNIEGEASITVFIEDDGPGDPPNVNTFSRTFKVTVSSAPDLEITNAVLSLNEVSRGQIFTVNSSVRNNGNENVESTFLNYYLSGDNIFDDGVDDLIGIVPIGPVIADGVENVWGSVDLKIPEDTPADDYYIIVVVDKTNNIPELNEDNNVFPIRITVNANKFPEIEYNNAPPVLLSDDQFINYRVVVTDDELQANPVSFFYRGISSDKEFTRRDAEEIEESLFQFTLDREEFLKDAIGIEYYFDAKDIGGLINQTDLAYTYEEYAAPGLTIDNLKYGSGGGDYQMVSVPLVLTGATPKDVFEDDFGPYDKEKWRLFRFQGGKNLEYTDGLEDIIAGNAYWLIVKDEPAEAVDTGPGITTQVSKVEPFVIQLRQGWNQIGSPYNFDVSWSDVISFNNDPAGVGTVLREYQNGGGFGETDVLKAFGGAFVESDTEVDILIPVVKNNGIQTETGRLAGTSGSAANQEGEWEVKVDLLTPEFSSRINGFGMKYDASYSNDRYDASSSPAFDFLNNVELKFDHPEYFQKSFTKDIRPVEGSGIWEFTIASQGSGFATMEWGDLGEKIGNKELLLYDIGQGQVINMLTTASYEVDLASSKAFKVYYGTREFIDDNLKPEHIHLGQSYPNPFTNLTHIPFTLAKSQSAYELELSVFNLMGQKVRALANGEFQPGFYELEWNGKNEKGDVQPSGIYLYKLIVKSPEGNDRSYYGRAILR